MSEHWEGCEEVHCDCRIAQLESELARLREQEINYENDIFLGQPIEYWMRIKAQMDADNSDNYVREILLLKMKLARLQEKLHDEMSQLEIATDLGNKRWIALNEIYENGEKHNANWCKRKAQEGLGIR